MDLYAQIEQELRAGQWGTTGRLPSYRSLAKHYDCSLTVIQQAFRNLDAEGLIYACRGKGTFWANSQGKSSFRQNKIIGVTYLNGCFKEELEDIKNDWLNLGWFLAGYNADRHFQDPTMERQFVMKARKEHFAGIVLLATPLPPTNRDLFMSMRLDGVKLAHLMPYEDDMTRESFFCVDYVAAGRLAVAEAARAGYKHIVYWSEGDSPDRRLNQQGITEMAAALRLEQLEDIDREHSWNQKEVDDFLAGKRTRAPGFLADLMNLPTDTCICTQSPVLLNQATQLLKIHDKSERRIGSIALDDFNGHDLSVNTIAFDHKAQLQAAFEYVADSRKSSTDIVQKLFPPTFVPRSTL